MTERLQGRKRSRAKRHSFVSRRPHGCTAARLHGGAEVQRTSLNRAFHARQTESECRLASRQQPVSGRACTKPGCSASSVGIIRSREESDRNRGSLDGSASCRPVRRRPIVSEGLMLLGRGTSTSRNRGALPRPSARGDRSGSRPLTLVGAALGLARLLLPMPPSTRSNEKGRPLAEPPFARTDPMRIRNRDNIARYRRNRAL